MQPNSYLLKCICLPEVKKDILYNVHLTMDNNGEIVSASCGCPAGAGPKGSRKHIATFSYALEEYCKIKELRSPQSCTSELQQWNQPCKRKLESHSIDISFIKHEHRKMKKVAPSVFYDPRPSDMRFTSDSSSYPDVTRGFRQNWERYSSSSSSEDIFRSISLSSKYFITFSKSIISLTPTSTHS